MKLILKIVFCLFFVHCDCLFSQDSTKHCFVSGIGIKSGVAISQLVMKNSSTDAANGKTGYLYSPSFSATGEFLHHKNFLLATDIGFIQRGGKVDSAHPYYNEYWAYPSQNPTNPNPETKLNFLTWDIVGKGGISLGDYFPYLNIGPVMDYPIYRGSKDEIHYSNRTRKINYSIVYGAGINYVVKKYIFSFDIYKYFHITPISESYQCDCLPSAVDGPDICLEKYGILSSNDIVISVGVKYLFTK